ncbi:methionyl-tRNA formyltransferase [Candidatus Poriferisodalis sp.]|uniref:methionyl-tRNA formyltransferase n=1 Tax=Candidatus Poriferisodalis sp. TaxID=3101277 RepID=UPI003B591D6B
MTHPLPTLPLPPNRPRRVAFAGTPNDAVPALGALAEAGFDIPLVVTGALRRRSRRGHDTPSPVAAAAEQRGLSISYDPADLAACDADCAVVVAYGRLLGADVLSQVPMLNLHFSLLPRWRGAAPVERALLAGDEVTGICLMALEETLDTGPVYWRHEVSISSTDTAASLRSRLAHEGAERLVTSLNDGLGAPETQQGEPTYARMLSPADREIDWSQPATHIDRQIRVGGAWTTLEGQRFIIRAGTPVPGKHDAPPGALAGDAVVAGHGLVRLSIVQPAGRAATEAQAWLNGARLPPGTRFG